MPMLKRNNAPRLLRKVGGQEHASEADHEEDARQAAAKRKEMTEDEINADPISSEDENPQAARVTGKDLAEDDINAEPLTPDDEEAGTAPRPPPTETAQTSNSSKRSWSSKSTKAASTGSRRSGRGTGVQIPRPGSYQKGRREKVKISSEEEKENVGSASKSSGVKREAVESIFGGMEHLGPKRRATQTAPKNIHAAAPAKYNVGKTGANKGRSSFHNAFGAQAKEIETEEEEDLDDIDMMDEQVEELFGKSSRPQSPIFPAKPTQPDRFEAFISYAKPFSSSANTDADTCNIDRPTSRDGGRGSKALHALRHNLELDVEALPIEDRDAICALCQASVDPVQSAAFYRERKRTVRNQTLFCKEHRRTTAQAEYQALGLPRVHWEGLPEQIRSYRPQLKALLRNKTKVESEYRKQHAEKLLSGRAAALPSKRKDQKTEELEEEMFATMDDADESTGFYGPRGKRIMMEVIGEVLVNDIGEAQATDPVVGRSGFAAFLQAVLVPELTVLLAMEDLGGVSAGVAKDKIAKSGELGVLLHEDVDDEVAWGSDEELSDMDEDDIEGLL